MRRPILAILCGLTLLSLLTSHGLGAKTVSGQTGRPEAITGGEANSPLTAKPTNQPPAKTESGTQAQAPARDLTPVFGPEREEQHQEQPGAAASIARTFGALLVVLSLVGAAAWALKRYGRRGITATDRTAFAVITTAPLADKRTLSVVRFGAQALLIGSTPTSMTLLATAALSEIEKLADAPNAATHTPTDAPVFARQLNQVYAELEANESEHPGERGRPINSSEDSRRRQWQHR